MTTLMDFADIATRPTLRLLAVPVDVRLDALQRRLLAALTNACRKQGGALYGCLRDVQAACGMAFCVSDLERLYETGYIDMSHDQGDWYFVEMEHTPYRKG